MTDVLKKQSSVVPLYGQRRNVGAYERPFSGVGEEFESLGVAPGQTGFVLHETGYWPRNHHWNFPNVFSPFWRVLYDFKPGHSVRFGGHQIPLRPGVIFIVPNHQRFDCTGDRPVPSLWFAFSTARNADPRQPMPIAVPLNPLLRAFVNELPRAFRKRSADRREEIRRLSTAFLVCLLGHPAIRWQPPLPEALRHVVAMINAAPATPWDNSSLAQAVHMSVGCFSRAFRRWMNTTPSRYVTQVRVREACRMLIETEQTIDEIAAQLGFPDRFYFSRVFRNATNAPPAAYRHAHSPLAHPDTPVVHRDIQTCQKKT